MPDAIAAAPMPVILQLPLDLFNPICCTLASVMRLTWEPESHNPRNGAEMTPLACLTRTCMVPNVAHIVFRWLFGIDFIGVATCAFESDCKGDSLGMFMWFAVAATNCYSFWPLRRCFCMPLIFWFTLAF